MESRFDEKYVSTVKSTTKVTKHSKTDRLQKTIEYKSTKYSN